MTNEEAKFVLSAYRPGGADARDPALAEALEQAERDPALRAWFDRSREVDRAVADALGEVTPPADLRASLLAGERLTPAPTAGWRRGTGWALAAAVAVLLTVGVAMWPRAGAPGGAAEFTVEAMREVARADLAGAHPKGMHTDELGEFGAWLKNPANRLAAGLPVDEARLVEDRCREVTIGGRRVFEVCFKRGDWFHVYIAPRDGVDDGELPGRPQLEETGAVALATWADDAHVYVLATAAGVNALKAVL